MKGGCLACTMTGVNHLAPIQEHMTFCMLTAYSQRLETGIIDFHLLSILYNVS